MTKDRKYDLEERAAKFGEKILTFCKKIPKDEITNKSVGKMWHKCWGKLL